MGLRVVFVLRRCGQDPNDTVSNRPLSEPERAHCEFSECPPICSGQPRSRSLKFDRIRVEVDRSDPGGARPERSQPESEVAPAAVHVSMLCPIDRLTSGVRVCGGEAELVSGVDRVSRAWRLWMGMIPANVGPIRQVSNSPA